jgi:predicted flap endonuclease-1-like 5' DNA nuclease
MARTELFRKLSLLTMQQGVSGQLNRIGSELGAVKNDLGAVRTDVVAIGNNVANIQNHSLPALQNEVAVIKTQLPLLTQKLNQIEIATGLTETPPVKVDRLRSVNGIGPATEVALRKLGIDTPHKLLARASSPQDIDKLSKALGAIGPSHNPDEIKDWVTQIKP